MLDETTATTSTGSAEGTTEDTSDSTSNTGTVDSDSTEERAEASSVEEEVKLDLESIPENLRPHVEKYAKKTEKDLKGAYTKKFQALSAKEKEWLAEKGRYEATAMEILKDPTKYEEYRKKYGLASTPAKTGDATNQIPDHVKTVGDFLTWQQQDRAALKEEVLDLAAKKATEAVAINKWETAINSFSQDKHFARHKDYILQIAQFDPDVRKVWNGRNEVAVLKAAQEKMRTLLREDMEELKAQTLAEQRKKSGATTTTPTKTVPTTPKAPQNKDEVIARVRARLGEASASQ